MENTTLQLKKDSEIKSIFRAKEYSTANYFQFVFQNQFALLG
jgi:hypothetical protein